MRGFLENLALLLGRAPRAPEPERFSDEARAIHDAHKQRQAPEKLAHLRQEREARASGPKKWRRRRWASLLAVNLLFVVSYELDIQLLEGTLTASRFMGFHMADFYAALQVMLAFKHVVVNLIIGTVTITLLAMGGGRIFCSWICPYHLLSEWAEMIHLRLAKLKRVRNHTFDRRARAWLWLTFSVLALITGYTIYETISPTGILSRALIYGPGIALAWIATLLLFEIFYSRRAWCRYACPIGLTYGVIGMVAPFKITYDLDKCFHDGACRAVCMVPHVLNVTRKGRAENAVVDLGGDCTRCASCVDACPTNALSFKIKGVGKQL